MEHLGAEGKTEDALRLLPELSDQWERFRAETEKFLAEKIAR